MNVFGSVALSNGVTINVADAGQTTTLQSVSGAAGVVSVTGSGTLSLTGANSFTGVISVSPGATLAVSSDQALGAGSNNIGLAGGTLAANGLVTSRSIGLNPGGGTLTGTGQFSGEINGTAGLTISGPSQIALTSTSNGYYGGTIVTGGATLTVAGDGSLGASTGSLTLDNGTLLSPDTSLTIAHAVALGSGGGTILGPLPPYTSTLTLSGKVTGSGALTVGRQTPVNYANVILSGTTNDYSGGTTVNFGSTLQIQNGTTGSATGSGALTVGTNATLAGAGTIQASTFNLASGSLLIVGSGRDVTSRMTLTGQQASTITNCQLVFNLGTGTSLGRSNELNLGSTPVTLSASTLELNIPSGIVTAGTAYTLITFDSAINPVALGLTVGANGQITGGLSLGSGFQITNGGIVANGTAFGTSSDGYATGAYAGSYLFVDGDDIDVMVVPEPSTWILLAAGVMGLGLVLRRRMR